LLGVARLFGSRRWISLFFIVPVLVFYALLAGGSSSIWRAAVAGLCIALALLLGRETDGLSLWSLALLILVLINPLQLHDLGFQLTFAATWGLLVLAPSLRKFLQKSFGRNWFCDAVAFSIAAQIATVPLLLYHFGRVSLVGFGANLLAVPVAGTLVATGMLGLVWSPVNILNYQLVRFLDGLAGAASQLPGAAPETPLFSLPLTIICYVALLMALPILARDESVRISLERWWSKQKSRVRLQGVVVACAALFTLWLGWNAVQNRNAPQVSVAILDVGQGEAIVVQSSSRTVLIDTGTSSDEGRGDAGRAIVVPFLQSRGIQKLDAIVLTHADADHCNGIPAVLREIPTDLVLDGAAFSLSTHHASTHKVEEYDRAKSAWQKRGIRSIDVRAGQKIYLGDGAVLTVLAPLAPALEGENNNAAVLRLDHGAVSFLLAADIERAGEERLLQRGAALRCTVLKVAHHGSKTSTTPEFLQRAKPQIAVISCGRYNRFGHPAPQTMERLQRAGVRSFRTDIHGTIELHSDGKTLRVETFR
jgi:competence protein ComEC